MKGAIPSLSRVTTVQQEMYYNTYEMIQCLN